MANSNQKVGDLSSAMRKNKNQSKEVDVDKEIALMKTELSKKIQDNQTEVQNMIAEFEKRMGQLMGETKESATSAISGKESTLSDEIKEQMKDMRLALEKKFEESIAKVQDHIIDKLNPQMNCVTLVERYGHFQPAFVWTIGKVKEMVKQETFQTKSEVFQWTGYPIEAQVSLKLTPAEEVLMSLTLDRKNQESLERLKVPPQIYYLLKDGSGNGEHRCRGISQLFRKSTNFGRPLEGMNHKIEERFIVDDCVVIEVYVEPLSMAKQVHSYDGTLDWAVSEYSKRSKFEKDNLVWCQDSPYFYTSPNGFRVKVEMWLKGMSGYKFNDYEDHTACIQITKGLFDADYYDEEEEEYNYVRKPFAHRITVTLVNRKDPQRSITKSVDGKFNIDQEFKIDMVESEEENTNLPIENDTLYYKVTVKAIE